MEKRLDTEVWGYFTSGGPVKKEETGTEEKNQASAEAPGPELFREGLEAELNKDREAATEFGSIEVVTDRC